MTGREAAEICNRYGITARKRWGQNFLCSEEISDRIISAAESSKDDSILEIGPGIGALTRKLCEKAERFLAIEIDPILVACLQDQLIDSTECPVICADYLKLHTDRIVDCIGRPQVLVSNLPYNLTTPIITKLITDFSDSTTMVFMVEEDACDRIFAQPSDKAYGVLSVITSAFGKKEKLFTVSPNHFFPSPHTSSAVIRFSREKGRAPIPSGFVSFVRDATAARRKTLLNALHQSLKYSDDVQRIKNFLAGRHLAENCRAETLTPDEFLALYRQLASDS